MHVGLPTTDLNAAIDFYRGLFGREPAKQRPDYAKFEVADPPLVLSLHPTGRAPEPQLHLGIRVVDGEALARTRSRVARAGLEIRDEPGVTCCYALQNKSWVRDPDGHAWEIYELVEDAEVHSTEHTECCDAGCRDA